MTMLKKRRELLGHWSVAQAKARLSHVLQESAGAPQVIENRGEPVAVVISIEIYRATLGDPDRQSVQGAAWRKFLEQSAQFRAEGGESLRVGKRSSRRDPFF
jgi:prevent-host-death family protein